ncbi:MAG TPA: DNA polymerase IV [Kineosporiaceae bacterium]|nr:DNA polymerase IV [Kineosporiaceae bacterium]
MRTRPVIVHLDLDAFFCAVEQLHKPSLRGKPVIVGGTGRRGVVATASYEARVFGVSSAMPIAQARRLCPNAAYLGPRFAAYRAASELVMGVVRELSPLVEQVSVDEAYIDLTPNHPGLDVASVTELAEGLRSRVHAITGLTASIGVGTSKLMAKIGSELDKPDGLTVIPPGEEALTLEPMPVRRLPGVGPATQARLHKRGITRIGDLARASPADVVDVLGQAHGAALHQYAHGIDHRAVVPERDAKSVSAEETFPTDLTGQRELTQHVRRLIERVATRLAADGTSGRTITLKLRRYDFSTITRSITLDQPTGSASKIAAAATQLLAAIDTSDGVRLLGVGVSGLTEYSQQDLLAGLDDAPHTKWSTESRTESSTDDGDAGPTDDESGGPSVAAVPPDGHRWTPGQDVTHPGHGAGWVQGAGLGRVTVRFEGPHTPPGPIKTFAIGDPELAPASPPVW